MYVQITSRCNMLCSHCGMNCTAQGEDMTFKTLKKTLEYAYEYIVFGGGEPTIHPQFEKFLFYAIGENMKVNIITNGKLKNKAIALANLSSGDNEYIIAELSQDPFHEKVNKSVVEAFKGRIRDTSKHLINAFWSKRYLLILMRRRSVCQT